MKKARTKKAQPPAADQGRAKTISYYVSPSTESAIRSRMTGADASASGALERILDRYGEIMRREQPQLTEAEWNLMRDVLNGCWLSPARSCAWIDIEAEDGIRLNGLDAKWEVDGPALVAKLRALTFAQRVAIVDAVEIWWAQPSPYEVRGREEGGLRSGLVQAVRTTSGALTTRVTL